MFPERLLRAWFDLEDRLFESRYGLELRGVIGKDELVADNADSLRHATAYQAVWCRNLRELLCEAAKTGIAFDTFIDVGCGKGKACFYAARRGAARRMLGIELSRPLVDVARRNAARFGVPGIEFHQVDAAAYELPEGDNLVFMFNPFDAVIMDRFIANNVAHFRNSRTVLAYANDIHRACLRKAGFETLFRNQIRKISLHRLGG